MKPLYLVGSALDDLREFPPDARHDVGVDLRRVQAGLDPRELKPISTVGAGVREIRQRMSAGAFRVFYVVASSDAVYVLHAFQKKSEQTPPKEIAKGAHATSWFPEASMTKQPNITRSTGNVFSDLGFDAAEAQLMLMRADLMIELEKTIAQRGLTQAAAGKLLGVSQARVSDLIRRKADRFSLDMLVTFAARLGRPTKLTVGRAVHKAQ